MKKNDLIILGSVAIYTLLFYRQLPGINYMLFNIVLVLSMVAINKSVLSQSRWLLMAIALFSTATCVLLYGNTLSVLANVLSLAGLSAFSFSPTSSLIIALLNGLYSFTVSLPIKLLEGVNQKYLRPKPEPASQQVTDQDNIPNGHDGISTEAHDKTNGPDTKPAKGMSFMAITFAISVAILFLLVYRSANPHFKELTDKFDMGEIWPIFRFALGGLIIVTGYYQHRAIKYLNKKDAAATSTMTEQNALPHDKTLLGKLMNMKSTIMSGILLLGLLNLMLLSINYFDVKYIWLDHPISHEVVQTQAQDLHESVNILIISIVMAIALILAYFRGSLNFDAESKPLKALAYLWVVQNLVLVVSVAIRNYQYIDNFGLTYKRIGVFVYLLLTLSGLITTLIKVWQYRSNWYLFRVNGWVFFSALVISCYVNWDVMITRFNLNNSKMEIDKGYLISSLGYANIPLITDKYKGKLDSHYKWILEKKIDRFLKTTSNTDLRSYCIERQKVVAYLASNWAPQNTPNDDNQ